MEWTHNASPARCTKYVASSYLGQATYVPTQPPSGRALLESGILYYLLAKVVLRYIHLIDIFFNKKINKLYFIKTNYC